MAGKFLSEGPAKDFNALPRGWYWWGAEEGVLRRAGEHAAAGFEGREISQL